VTGSVLSSQTLSRVIRGGSLGISVSLSFGLLLAQEGHGVSPFQIERGEQIFISKCAICHGPDGDAIPGANLLSGKFRHAATQRDLIGIIKSGIPGTPMPPGNYSAGQIQMLVAYLYSVKPSVPLIHSKFPGDASRGKQIFEGRGHCLDCHRVNGAGKSFLGPDLSNIGAIRRSATLQLALLDPSAEIRIENRTVRIVREDGAKFVARLLNQDTYSLQILTAEGKLESVYKRNLSNFEIMKTSPMPSYRGKLDDQELMDLVAYMVTLKGNGI